MTVRDLRRDFDPEILDRLYADVLEPTFAPEELDSAESMAAGLAEGRAGLAWVALAGDEVLGGLVAERHPGSDVLLVGYLAVRPDRRGGGVGSALMERLREHCEGDAEVRLALGEVHDPRQHPDAGDRALDRLRFFERQGARVLDVPFVQPALGPQGSRVPGFLLLAFYVDPRLAPETADRIPAEVVSRFVRRYYEVTEGAAEPYDAQLGELIGRIERDRAVALLPVSGYERVAA